MPKPIIAIRVSEDQKAALAELAYQRRTTVSALVLALVEDLLTETVSPDEVEL